MSDLPVSAKIARNQEEEIVRKYLKGKGYSDTVIKRIMYPSSKVTKYKKEDISNALVIHTQSAKAYETMRRNNMTVIPLPHPVTLNLHTKHFLCSPGIQQEIFAMLGAKMASEQ